MTRSSCPSAGALLCVLFASGCALPIIGATHGPGNEYRARDDQRVQFVRRGPQPLAMRRGGEACYDALSARRVAFERVPPRAAMGVQTPVRLLGPIRGVEIATAGRNRKHAILDCRLALTLFAWAPSLRDAGVVRVEHYSIYRPRARTPRRGRVSGHARGLAIDAARFHLRNGAVLDVLTDWEDRDRGSSPCPKRPDEAWPSRILRGVVCDAVESNLFQVVLTPHHDRAHENHVHLEIKPEVNWTYVR